VCSLIIRYLLSVSHCNKQLKHTHEWSHGHGGEKEKSSNHFLRLEMVVAVHYSGPQCRKSTGLRSEIQP
jgi:hypothetical protein